MRRIAIVGTGITGLACAYLLHRHFRITLLEQNAHVGGHANTVTVREGARDIPVDTGFMVFNKVTYPLLTRLFRELEVKIKPTEMSFSVRHSPANLEFCGSSLKHLFGQRRNIANPRFWAMLWQIHRFNREAVMALDDSRYQQFTVRQFVVERGYGSDFQERYLVPMSSAVWSTPPELMLEFPVMTLIRFFHNHGFLGLRTQHPWWTVEGGARSYVAKILETVDSPVRLNDPVTGVERNSSGAFITTQCGSREHFDKVILACHADQTLGILKDAGTHERRLLSAFKYHPNVATLHTDDRVMPLTRDCWSSWNYRIDKDDRGIARPSTVYWMNRLQGVSDRQNYFVSVNGAELIRPEHVLRRIHYEHPVFSLQAVAAQRELPGLNLQASTQPAYFCGSYFRYGFHEDALSSAVAVARELIGKEVWA